MRRAWDVFRQSPPGLACLQAQLNIYNPGRSWLTRQFTIEYSALFDAILPALESLRLPVPLGGTSNHFPRALLIGLGAWDPYNVTEDADLGIRIARAGYHTGVLASTTWEEAPPVLGVWLKQRTRWLKGWMQTYLVHTRQWRRLNRELGLSAAIGFHALMGGLIASALVHPLFYALLTYHWLSGSLLAPAEIDRRRSAVGGRRHQPRHRLRRIHSGGCGERAAPTPTRARAARPADAVLLAADLSRRLPRRLATRPQSVSVGEDGAWPGWGMRCVLYGPAAGLHDARGAVKRDNLLISNDLQQSACESL